MSGYSSTQENLPLSIEQIDKEQQKYTGAIAQRFAAWKKLILTNRNDATFNKLKVTNDFFNQFIFHYEDNTQGVEDYWQTPEEFIVSGEGDCEDFSIAKYFTLLALGVPMQTLRITYVKSVKLNRAHMVLAFYAKPNAEPLVLDNLVSEILPASKRPDLIPVYSFNGQGLWLAKQRSSDKFLGDSNRLTKWQSLIQRMQKR
ncbi:transglutaminase-like cysteine peptidase [Legionella cardiaca]|uniref:Transglutaminase-like cysteine peptidase n=1 Tax=Legionella cardiaca TaxID=1071983 RepID=A0ABY8AWL3_9GAMM|nr:transglutaminase-like cysteine peptidase [Legionella cardiaca]WED43885.1 transglutaminase-like cysteine peptidase [Legionella cardiaca]